MDISVNTKSKFSFTLSIEKIMKEMGLKMLISGVDYSAPLPNIVAVYPDKEKYYLIEPLSDECFSSKSPRLYKEDEYKDIRNYCKRLFQNDIEKGIIVASILCEMAAGIEMFTYKLIGTCELISMTKYASLAVPCPYEKKACEALEYLKLEYRTLNILDKFTLILIDRSQTAKLPEIKKFIRFIITNK